MTLLPLIATGYHSMIYGSIKRKGLNLAKIGKKIE